MSAWRDGSWRAGSWRSGSWREEGGEPRTWIVRVGLRSLLADALSLFSRL